jgi:hypothetical protein
MDFIRIYKDESFICANNKVSANMLVPGQFYFWQYNSLVVLFQCINPWSNNYVKVKFIIFNGYRITDQYETVLHTNRCRFYKVENPLLKEIKNIRVTPPVPSLRMLSYNQLDDDTKIEYSYAANVHGQFPPIPPDYSFVFHHCAFKMPTE